MAEIKNLGECSFLFCADIGTGQRLSFGNARIIETKKESNLYCVYPSLGIVRDEGKMPEILHNLELEIGKRACYTGS